MKNYSNIEPELTILMPAYNAEKWIKESIESILSQTFKNFEFLIINDGSTDNTSKIIQAYEKIDARIRFLQNERNIGLIATLNRGLRESKTDLIARMDADDISVPTRIETQMAYLKAHPDVDILGGAIQCFGASNKKITPPP